MSSNMSSKLAKKWNDIYSSFSQWNEERKELTEKYLRESRTGITDEEREKIAKNSIVKRENLQCKKEAVKAIRELGIKL